MKHDGRKKVSYHLSCFITIKDKAYLHSAVNKLRSHLELAADDMTNDNELMTDIEGEIEYEIDLDIIP